MSLTVRTDICAWCGRRNTGLDLATSFMVYDPATRGREELFLCYCSSACQDAGLATIDYAGSEDASPDEVLDDEDDDEDDEESEDENLVETGDDTDDEEIMPARATRKISE